MANLDGLKLVDIDETKNKHKKYTRKQLIEKIQQWTKENGRIPTEKDFNDNHKCPSYVTYAREFGTWNNALIEAGIGIKKKYSRKQLIEKLQEWQNKNGRIPGTRDFSHNPKYPSFVTYQKEFGTWNNALITAELVVRQKYRIYSRKQLIEIMQEWTKENGGIPTEKDFNDNPKYPSHVTYQYEFGSWTSALIAAGFEPNGNTIRSRQGEVQTISEFKTEGAIDLSGQNRNATCDGICPKGEKFDTKSASLTKKHGHWSWTFSVSIGQLEYADYLFLRAYEDKDFTKPPIHKWRIPIGFMNNRTVISIYKDNKYGMYNVDNMTEYEII